MTESAEKRLRAFLEDGDAAGEHRISVYREDVRALLDEVTRLRDATARRDMTGARITHAGTT